MAHDSRTSRMMEGDEAENVRRGQKRVKESPSPSNGYGLRSSVREISSKSRSDTPKRTSSSSKSVSKTVSTRRSERLEKRSVTTSPAKRVSQRVKGPGISSSPSTGSRSSSRAKGESNSIHSKSSDVHSGSSSCMKRKKGKKEKSVKQLTEETKEVGISDEEDSRPVKILKTMHSQDFKALLKRVPKKRIVFPGNFCPHPLILKVTTAFLVSCIF